MPQVSQIGIVTAVLKELIHQGFPDADARHVNAVVAGADLVVKAYAEPHRSTVAGSGLTEWLLSDETGLSSKAMAKHLAPIARIKRRVSAGINYPHDPADLGRCVGLLDAVPELRPHLPRMAEVSPTWAALVGRWDELEALYREERPGGRAPKCYRRMRELIEGAEKAERDGARSS